MKIPNNEGIACDAVIQHHEKWTDETRAEIRHSESDGVGPPVELRLQLGNQNYCPEFSIMLSADKMPSKVEKSVDRRVDSQKSLRLCS